MVDSVSASQPSAMDIIRQFEPSTPPPEQSSTPSAEPSSTPPPESSSTPSADSSRGATVDVQA